MSVTYDRMAALYSGTAGPVVSNVAIAQSGCQIRVTFDTDVVTFPRGDLSRRAQIATKEGSDHRVSVENAVVSWAQQGSTAGTSHQLNWTVQPAEDYRLDVRGFDADGRQGSTDPLHFIAPAIC